MESELINWFQEWFNSNCDGEWEHSHGLTIESLDNPGWFVKIDLRDTLLEFKLIQNDVVDNGNMDWHQIKIVDFHFQGAGSPNKLNYIIQKFREFATMN